MLNKTLLMLASEATKANRVSKDGVMKNVHVLGLESKNGLIYADAISEAVTSGIYNGIDVYLNHDKTDTSRFDNITAKIGILENTTEAADGIHGDLQLNVKHPYYEAIVWWADKFPDRLGLSHVADLKVGPNKVVEKIVRPRTVDLVSKPATTRGIFSEAVETHKEGVIADDIKSDWLCHVMRSVQDIYYELKYPVPMPMNGQAVDDKIVAEKMIPVLKDAAKELGKFIKTNLPTENEPVDGTSSEATIAPEQKNTQSKVKDMELKDITIEMLKKDRSDLVSVITTEAIEAEKALDAKVTDLTKGLPAVTKTVAFTKLVRESVAAGKDVSELISDRLALVVATEAVKPPAAVTTGGPSPTTTVVATESVKTKTVVTDDLILSAFNTK